MSRAKQVGTAAETAVLRYLTAHGMLNVARRTLTGSSDTGDIWVDGGTVVLEVKSRNRPHTWADVGDWLAELEREVKHADAAGAGCSMSALVVKRVGSGPANVGDWFVYLNADDAAYLLTGTGRLGSGWMATTLEQWTTWASYRLAHRGPYGLLG
jgi:hypothetical protein